MPVSALVGWGAIGTEVRCEHPVPTAANDHALSWLSTLHDNCRMFLQVTRASARAQSLSKDLSRRVALSGVCVFSSQKHRIKIVACCGITLKLSCKRPHIHAAHQSAGLSTVQALNRDASAAARACRLQRFVRVQLFGTHDLMACRCPLRGRAGTGKVPFPPVRDPPPGSTQQHLGRAPPDARSDCLEFESTAPNPTPWRNGP